jgi:glycosyltransferase involved in cell wall biosynthesis
MAGLKFLLSTYSTAFLASGGGESELVQIAETLNESGVHADIYGIQSRPLDFYDAVMHFSVQAEGKAFFDAVHGRQTPILLWPNVWWNSPPSDAEIARIQPFIDQAHKVLFKSRTESEQFAQYVNVPDAKRLVVPICVSSRFTSVPDLALARTICEMEDYVLCLGRVEPVKNQLTLIRALRQLGLQGVMVGGHNDSAYLRACKAEAGDSVQFLPWVKPCSRLLVSLLACSRIVAETSFDPAGRSSLEAALANKPLVLSADDWVNEYFADTVYKADPHSLEQTVEALQRAMRDRDVEHLAAKACDRISERHASASAANQFVTAIVDACDR